MSCFHLPLQEQYRQLQQWIRQAESFLKDCPPGSLTIYRKNNRFEYYLQDPSSPRRTYLRKEDHALARQLAQKDYAVKFLSCARKLEKELEKLQEQRLSRSASAMYTPLADIYDKLSEPRKQLVKPYVLPDQEFIAAWLTEKYTGGVFRPEDVAFLTERGEKVRSKSEKIIADKYHMLGIPYRYEYPVFLKGLGIVHGDYHLLDIRERTTVIHEHLGMMQKEDYCLKSLTKMEAYAENGYILGVDILFTFESTDHPLSPEVLDKIIRDRFF